MSIVRPGFIDSPYFVGEPDNWHLLDGAPEDVQKEFDEYMAYAKKMEDEGVDV